MGKYDFGYEITDGSTYAWALQNITPGSRVLEFGPYNGKLTVHLKKDLNCIIDIVEIDEEAGSIAANFAEHALIGSEKGNIERYHWVEEFGDTQYDYIVMLDVLEHLTDTKKVITSLKAFLKPEGKFLFSVPNVAYNGLIMGLINDNFNYNELGLLDNTHVRFFTYHSIEKLAKELGFRAFIDALQLPVRNSEFHEEEKNTSQQATNVLNSRKYGNVYQYLVTFLQQDICAANILPCIEYPVDNTDHIIIYYGETLSELSENHKITKSFCPFNNAYISVEADLTNVAGEKMVFRIDPMDKPGLIGNISIMLRDDFGEYHQGEIIGDSGLMWNEMICFNNNDPQILIKPVGYHVSSIRISFSIFFYNDFYFTNLFCDLYGRAKLKYISENAYAEQATVELKSELEKDIKETHKRISEKLESGFSDLMATSGSLHEATDKISCQLQVISDFNLSFTEHIKSLTDKNAQLQEQNAQLDERIIHFVEEKSRLEDELGQAKSEIERMTSTFLWKFRSIFIKK